MATEVLAVPEEHLDEVIEVLRAGLDVLGKKVSRETRQRLEEWCSEEEDYLKG